MSGPTPKPTVEERELVIHRVLEIPAERLYEAWTTPAIMKQWFVPRPWTIADVQLDVRVGGGNTIVMQSPEGDQFPNSGVYLEIIPNKKLVFTDAYTQDWEPSAEPFMTVILTFEDLGNGKTDYTIRARHFTIEGRKKHEEMGFFPGWNQCLDQLVELLTSTASTDFQKGSLPGTASTPPHPSPLPASGEREDVFSLSDTEDRSNGLDPSPSGRG